MSLLRMFSGIVAYMILMKLLAVKFAINGFVMDAETRVQVISSFISFARSTRKLGFIRMVYLVKLLWNAISVDQSEFNIGTVFRESLKI